MRMASPDGSCIGIDINTERGRTAYNGRTFEVTDPRHIRLLKAEGAFAVDIGGVTRTRGFVCPSCSFRAFFKICGRCGATCAKEN